MRKTLIALGVVVVVAAGALIFVVLPSINKKGGPGLQSLGTAAEPGHVGYLKINGVNGESIQKAYTGYMEVPSFEWGATAPREPGSGQTTGRVQIQEFSFTKVTDGTTPELVLGVTSSKHYTDATLALVRPDQSSGQEVEFMKYIFTDVVLTSYKLGSGKPTMDSVSFTFATHKVEYKGKPGKV